MFSCLTPGHQVGEIQHTHTLVEVAPTLDICCNQGGKLQGKSLQLAFTTLEKIAGVTFLACWCAEFCAGKHSLNQVGVTSALIVVVSTILLLLFPYPCQDTLADSNNSDN